MTGSSTQQRVPNWLLCGHHNSRNLGDRLTDLRLYFPALAHLDWVDIEDLPSRPLDPYTGVLFGAGGMLYGESQDRMEAVVATGKPVCVFGAGLNYDNGSTHVSYPSFLRHCRYVALRDWGSPYDWCPCPSALDGAFDDLQPVLSRSQVTYGHIVEDGLRVPGTVSLAHALSHFHGADIVRTDSYHGVYWASLVGATPFILPHATGIKFTTFHSMPLDVCRRAIHASFTRLLHALCNA